MFFKFDLRDDDDENRVLKGIRRAPASFFLSFFRFFSFSQARQFKTSFDDDDDDEITKLGSSLKIRMIIRALMAMMIFILFFIFLFLFVFRYSKLRALLL